MQDVVTPGQYRGFIVQPIFGPGLTGLVEQAIAKGIKVVASPRSSARTTDRRTAGAGQSANVAFVPPRIGQLGQLVVQACPSRT